MDKAEKALSAAAQVRAQFIGHGVVYEELLAALIASHPNRDELLEILGTFEAQSRSPSTEMLTGAAIRVCSERLRDACLARIAGGARPD